MSPAPLVLDASQVGTQRDEGKTKMNTIEEDVVFHSTHELFTLRTMRLRLLLVLCLGSAVMLMMSACFGMAIVCMVRPPVQDIGNGTTRFAGNSSMFFDKNVEGTSCSELTVEEQTDYGGTIDWSSTDQSTVMSLYFWGTMLGSLPGGYMADRFGPVRLMSVAVALNAINSLLLPSVALHLVYAYTALVRFVIGIGFGVFFSSANSLIAKWIPHEEKTWAVGIYSVGNQVGLMIAPLLGVVFCPLQHLYGGWPLIFYICGGAASMWLVLFTIVATNSPQKNRFVGEEEKMHISRDLNQYHFAKRSEASSGTPWRSMFTSPVTLSILFCSFACAFTEFTITLYIPTYFKTVLKMDIRSNGLLSAAPFIGQMVFKLGGSFVVTHVVRKGWIASLSMNKLIVTGSTVLAGGFVAVMAFCDCGSSSLAVVCMVALFSLGGLHSSGFVMMIAPAYTGVMASAARLTAGIGGMIGPYIVSAIVHEGTAEEWRVVFLIMSLSLISCGVTYGFCGSNEVQHWALPEHVRTQQMSGKGDRSNVHPNRNKSMPAIQPNGQT